MNFSAPRSSLATIVLIVALSAAWVRGQTGNRLAIVRENDATTVDEKGDATFTGRIVFPSEQMYSIVKANFPNPYVLLRSILGSSGKADLTNATVAYDDQKRSLQMTATMLGAAIDKRNKWRIDIGKNSELLHLDGRTCVLLNVAETGGMTLVVSAKIDLPQGAKSIQVDGDSGLLSYEFDRAAKAGNASINAEMKVKPRLMSAVYKVYGDREFAQGSLWTAKTVFTNTGSGDITHLKVSYRIGDYAPWSPPTEYSLLVPGGHLVDLYYPLLNREVTDLRSQTPADLEVKYTYSDTAGKEYSDSLEPKRITLLDANGFEFSNVTPEERTTSWADAFSNNPLMAAWVNKMDDPVRAFSGMVAQASGGQPGGISDEGTVRFCATLYNMELLNGIAYQGSVGLSTDSGGAQEIKFPRDVLRDKSGTCVELAITYAAVCESAGIKCTLVLVPGHCFVVANLPSGNILPVECTGISGPALEGFWESLTGKKHPEPFSFEEVVKVAGFEFSHREPGRSALVDVDAMQSQGVLCPELPKVAADIVNTWGYKVPQGQGAVVNQNPGGPNDPSHPAAMVGDWRANGRLANGLLVTATVRFDANGNYQGVVVSGQGAAKDEGEWKVVDGQLVEHSVTYNKIHSRPITIQQDELDVQDPVLGNIRWRRAN